MELLNSSSERSESEKIFFDFISELKYKGVSFQNIFGNSIIQNEIEKVIQDLTSTKKEDFEILKNQKLDIERELTHKICLPQAT